MIIYSPKFQSSGGMQKSTTMLSIIFNIYIIKIIIKPIKYYVNKNGLKVSEPSTSQRTWFESTLANTQH